MKRAVPLLVLLATLATSSLADARRAVVPPEAQRLVISVVVYGEDRCPEVVSDEIVVCARKPESERYRIPKDLRNQMVVAGPQSWGSRVATVEAEGRRGLPGSCSPFGSYGQTGCARAAGERWFLERQQMKKAEALP